MVGSKTTEYSLKATNIERYRERYLSVLSCDIIQNQLSNADHYSSQLVRGAMISQLSELYFTISLYGQLNSNACLY